jgi:hypothetical protein
VPNRGSPPVPQGGDERADEEVVPASLRLDVDVVSRHARVEHAEPIRGRSYGARPQTARVGLRWFLRSKDRAAAVALVQGPVQKDGQ